MNRLRKNVYALLNQIYFEYDRLRDYQRDKHLISDLNLPKLSKQEKKEIRKVWPCFKFSNLDFIWMRIYKAEHGFDPYFLCDHQYSILLRTINNSSGWNALTNKALCDIYMPRIPWPYAYIRKINNKYYDHNMVNIGVGEAMNVLMSLDGFVVKPAVDTGGGAGVKVVTQKLDRNELENILIGYSSDLVVQTIINQNNELKIFNPSSVNSCRITTIHLGNKRSHVVVFKVGRKHSTIDNWSNSVFVGVSNDGKLLDYGYDINLKRISQSDEGVTFDGHIIPDYDRMVDSVHGFHDYYFPKTAIIGWDITVDNLGALVVIEANVSCPIVLGPQLCMGTFFKDFRDEICNCYLR